MRWRRGLAAGLAAMASLAAASSPAWAQPTLSLAQAFEAALQHDADYRAAIHERDAALEGVPIARASLLPAVNLNASVSRVQGQREFPNALNQTVRTQVNYDAPQASLSMRAPLFNLEARRRVDVAQAQADGADAVLRVRSLDLVDRLGAAYLGVLLAQDGLALAQAQLEQAQAQLSRAQQRLARGEGTQLDVSQAGAALDVTQVRVVEATHEVNVAQRALQRVTGLAPMPLHAPSHAMLPVVTTPATLEEWVALSLRQSATLQAREQALAVARSNVDRVRAGHYPRLDAVASLSESRNDSVNNLNQSSRLGAVGLQLSVPLYAGGGVDASVRQALAEQARAEESVRAEREAVELEVQRQYLAVASSANKVKALRVAEASASLALQAASAALDRGLGVTTDVIDAQTRLFAVRRDLAEVGYLHLLAHLRLLAAAGTPMADVVTHVDRLLQQPVPVNAAIVTGGKAP